MGNDDEIELVRVEPIMLTNVAWVACGRLTFNEERE